MGANIRMTIVAIAIWGIEMFVWNRNTEILFPMNVSRNAIAMMTVMALVAHAPEEHARVLRNFETELAILREGADPHFRVGEAPIGDVSAGA